LSTSFEKVTSDASKTAVNAADSVKKDVGRGLRQYNAKAQKTADKIPGGLGKQAASYPWVAMSIALIIGLPVRKFTKSYPTASWVILLSQPLYLQIGGN
jgi:hypothetical protein